MSKTDAELLDWIEEKVKTSRTGVSIDRIPPVDGEPGGFRLMRCHFIGSPAKTVRAAIEKAIKEGA